MKVFELMKLLGELPANADVQCCCDEAGIFGPPMNVDFDGKAAADAFVNIKFDKSPDCD